MFVLLSGFVAFVKRHGNTRTKIEKKTETAKQRFLFCE